MMGGGGQPMGGAMQPMGGMGAGLDPAMLQAVLSDPRVSAQLMALLRGGGQMPGGGSGAL